MIARKEMWRGAFHTCISQSRRKPFELGVFDCGIFVADVLLALTGFDHAAQFRGRYTTIQEAKRTLRSYGFKNHVDVIAALFPEIHPSEATVGDIVAAPSDDVFKVGLGVVNGETCFVLTPNGLGTIHLLEATRAFRV